MWRKKTKTEFLGRLKQGPAWDRCYIRFHPPIIDRHDTFLDRWGGCVASAKLVKMPCFFGLFRRKYYRVDFHLGLDTNQITHEYVKTNRAEIITKEEYIICRKIGGAMGIHYEH